YCCSDGGDAAAPAARETTPVQRAPQRLRRLLPELPAGQALPRPAAAELRLRRVRLLFEHQGETCTATAVILYFLIMFGLAVEGLTLGLVFGIFPGFIPVLVLSAAALFVLLHRPVRGLWVWCLWRMGFLR